jgi:hypothetical protein
MTAARGVGFENVRPSHTPDERLANVLPRQGLIFFGKAIAICLSFTKNPRFDEISPMLVA